MSTAQCDYFGSVSAVLTSGCAALGRYCLKFARALARPTAVFGPVLRPPCHLQRALPGSLSARQGFPSRRRRAPQKRRSRTRKARPHASWRCRSSAKVQPNLFARARVGSASRTLCKAACISALLVIAILPDRSRVKGQGPIRRWTVTSGAGSGWQARRCAACPLGQPLLFRVLVRAKLATCA